MFIQKCKCEVSRVAIPMSNQVSKAEENNEISERQKRSPRRKMIYSWRQRSRASRKVKLIMLSRRVKEAPREFGHEPSSSAYEKRKKWSGKGKKNQKKTTREYEGSDEVWKEVLCLFSALTSTKEICHPIFFPCSAEDWMREHLGESSLFCWSELTTFCTRLF